MDRGSQELFSRELSKNSNKIISIFSNTRRALVGILPFLGYSLAFLFEERFVDFEITHDILPAISRVVCGIMLYIALQYVWGMGIFDSMLSRSITGFLTYFILFGLYPWIFTKIPIFSGN